MNTFKYLTGTIAISLFMIACSSDDESPITEPEIGIDIPITYSFERNNSSTISFSGQTTRIAMAEAFAKTLTNNIATKEELDAILAHQEGAANFEDSALNESDKNIKSKIAASRDFFATNTEASAEIKADFDQWVALQVAEVFPKWDMEATPGTPGNIQEAGGGSTRYISGRGLEYNQVIAKGLIGALMTDQTLNNYLSEAVLDESGNRADNDAGIVAEEKNYTTMEHKWDEAYGYVYGASADPENPNATIGEDDNFLNKYIGRVENDPDFTGIAATIYDAFKLGRAAIVAKQYKVRDAQAAIIRQKISEIIAIRAVFYLQQGKLALGEEPANYGAGFHDLSEGYGFIYSLQFTRKPGTENAFFSSVEVRTFLDQLMAERNGLWDVAPTTLDEISEAIAAQFDFTVAQAASTN